MQKESDSDAYEQYYALSYEEIRILSQSAQSHANYNNYEVPNPILKYKITLDLEGKRLVDVNDNTQLHRIYFLSELVENLEKGISVYQNSELIRYMDNQICDELAEKLTRNQLRCEKAKHFNGRLELYNNFKQEGMLTNETIKNISGNLEQLCILTQHFNEQNYYFKPDDDKGFNVRFVTYKDKQNKKLAAFFRQLSKKELTLNNCGIEFFKKVYLSLGNVKLKPDGEKKENVVLARHPIRQVAEFMEIVTYFNLRQKIAKELPQSIIGRNLMLIEENNEKEVDFIVFQPQRNFVILAAEITASRQIRGETNQIKGIVEIMTRNGIDCLTRDLVYADGSNVEAVVRKALKNYHRYIVKNI